MTLTGSTTITAPVAQTERILMLDSLRGIAILGILLMNMPGFAISNIVDNDPFLLAEQGTINYYIWYVVTWLFNGTQRALFSMLFGAGILLFIGRKENNLEGLKPADYFFRRQLWLIALSLFDVFVLLWHGDILLDYACIGMLLFAFRNLSPKALIIAATISLIFMTARENRDFYQRKSVITKGEAVAAIDTLKIKLTDRQKDDLEAMTAFRKRTTKEGKLKRVNEENEKARGDYATVYEFRTGQYIDTLVPYLYFQVWDVLIFMFLGMAFFKLGILTGDAPTRTYFWMGFVGLALGLSLSYFRVQSVINYKANWFELVKNVSFVGFNLDRVGRSVGILGAIMLLYKSGWFSWLFATLRPVGQMALTNYLSQSLICSLIFNGFAFGLFGRLQRYEIYLVVLAIWVFQIILCNVWMRYFFYGPCEWVWRSLTYWKRQPFVKA